MLIELPSQKIVGRLRQSIVALWPLIADKRLALTGLVALGVATAIAEGLGFSLVIVLVYELIGGPSKVPMTGPVGIAATFFHFIGQNPVWVASCIAFVVIAKGVLASIFELEAGRMGGIASNRARTAIFSRYLEQDYQKLMEHDQSVLINRISYDSEMISRVVSYMAGILINFLAIAVYGLFITRLSSFLAAIVVVLGLVLIGSIGLWVKQVSLVGAAASLVQRDLFSRMLNGVQALRTIRLYGAEKSFEEDFSRTSSLIEATSLKRAKLMHASHPVRDVGLLIVLGTFLWIAHQLHTSVGVTAIIVAMLYRMLPHINSIEQQAMDIFSLVEPLHETARTIFPDYAEEPAPRPAHAFDRKFETIEFHNVSYKYPTAEYMTLVDVNFRFNRGALVVINGASGSGKSTVVNLLAGLLKPGSGTIFLDDVALCDIERSSWVRCLAFAGQDVEMIDGSLADNIRLARPDISDQDVRAALSAVEALDFVDRLPNGIHTNVGDRGFRLSGGQRQRIGLARALVAQPEILILDEATNAIDLATEALIFANIDKMLPGATKIIITHRENVENADLTVMLDWGYVVRLHAPADPASCFDKRESAQ